MCVRLCVSVCVCAYLSRIYHSGAGLNSGVVVYLATVVAVVGGRCKGTGFIKEILHAFWDCHVFIKENFKAKAARVSCQSRCGKKSCNQSQTSQLELLIHSF